MPKYGHHDARGNLEFIADNLILLQDHFSGVNIACPDCMLKHLESIRAYATEGFALDNADAVEKELHLAAGTADDILMIISKCMTDGKCEIKSKDDMAVIVDKLRMLRREINRAVYGLSGDLVYESEEKHGLKHKEEKKEGHSHSHEGVLEAHHH